MYISIILFLRIYKYNFYNISIPAYFNTIKCKSLQTNKKIFKQNYLCFTYSQDSPLSLVLLHLFYFIYCPFIKEIDKNETRFI